MKLAPAIEQAAISSFVDLIGHGDIFTRIVDEIHRTNASMPDATGADKRHKVLADLDIIFKDLIVPVGESVLRMLLELGVAYIKSGAIATL